MYKKILSIFLLLGLFGGNNFNIFANNGGVIEDDFEIVFPIEDVSPVEDVSPIDGACNTDYHEKNIFSLGEEQPLCSNNGKVSNFSLKDDEWTWTCDGIDGGDAFSCKANKLSTPVVENPETTTTSIKWKWKNNDKNSKDVKPKNIIWFDHEPKEEEKVSTGGLIWNYTQGGLKDNTPYTSYIVAFDDLGKPSEPIKLTGSTKKTPSGGGGGGGYVPPSQPKEPKDEDKIETPKEEEKNDDPTPTKEKPSTPSTPTDPQDPKQEEKPEKSTPVYPIIKHPKRTCEPNELVMETRCIYPNIDFTLNDIQDNFAYKYIYSLASAGIVQGYYDTGLFQPDNSISRSEYLKILFKAFCIEYSETSTQNIPFTDVESENWEAKIIAKALELDIISKENTLFRPHQAISRAESMKLLFKVAGVIPQDVHVGLFEDVPNETWEVKYIQKAYESCIIDGKEIQGNLYFEPYQNTTRAEVSKIIANALMLER